MAAYPSSLTAEFNAQSAAFRFVALLAGELSRGQVDLPAFPEAVARVKAALSDEQVTPALIARVVAAEAGLAARLMTLANSAIMNPAGAPITELKTAIVRIGYNNVRAAAVAYAVAKLRQADELQDIRNELEALWKEATVTASLAHVIAWRTPQINADEAMLAGLVHNIGKVYILSRSRRQTHAAFGAADTAGIVRDWHANVGKAIVESWKFAPHIVAAIGDYEEQERASRQAGLGDVLELARRLCPCVDRNEQHALPESLLRSSACQRLGMDARALQQVLVDGATVLKELRAALGA